MLDSLTILNGTLSLKFDKYNNIYSVLIDDDVTSLDIDYKANDLYTVEIINNGNFVSGENTVYINLVKDEKIYTYTLLVYKEKTTLVFQDYSISDEAVYEMPSYLPYVIGISCFIFILFTFFALFNPRKKHNFKKF
jgi:hypothetical protein